MSEDAHDSDNKKDAMMKNRFQDDNRKRMEMYKAQEEAYQRSNNIDELNKRVLDLQFANIRIYNELQAQRKLCDVLIARLNQYNEPPPAAGEYTKDDLELLRQMGIQP